MAGIGIRLQKIYEKNTIFTYLTGFGYSTVVTIAPMFLVVGTILLMSAVLGYDTVSYARRGLFSGTVLYMFVFSLLTASPFNAVLARYMSDVIYEERYEDILPCFELGLFLNMLLAGAVGIPFCVREYLVGKVHLLFVFTGYSAFLSLVLVFYAMLYLSVCKDYAKISWYFFLGMTAAFLLALFFVKVCGREVVYSMLLALTCGFVLIAVLELATVRHYFKKNSYRYRRVLHYFWKYRLLVIVNFLYTLGLYAHNFVFWGSDLRMTVANTFVFAPSYDLATFLGMFTNISATIIFISRVEMHFHARYRAYSEAVIGGRWSDIENTKNRMFRQLSGELLNLVRIQFIISVALYLVCTLLLPRFGYSGRVLRIYPCLAAGYFILFLLYAEIIFLYYFNDLTGSFFAAASFCATTVLVSFPATGWGELWYGAGLVAGSFVGFTVAYVRLRWVERHMDEHTFCRGELFPVRRGVMPDCVVYRRDSDKKGEHHR